MRRPRLKCLCGCGLSRTHRENEYRLGHNPNPNRRKFPILYCKCGCGKIRTNVFFRLTKEDLFRPSIRQYLLLTSLPFVIDHPDVSDGDIEKRIRVLWKSGIERCKKCSDVVTRLTMPTGNLFPKIMIICEAPGVGDGEKEGFDRVLVYGRTSYLLRSSLDNLGVYYDSYFTNLLKCSLPKNREGKIKEYETCFPNLRSELEILKPEIIILFGNKVKNFFPTAGKTDEVLAAARIRTMRHPTSYLYSHDEDGFLKDIRSILEMPKNA